MNTPLTRRRFFAIAAFVAGGALLPFVWKRRQQGHGEIKPAEDGEPIVWKGIALGSGAELRLYHTNRKTAELLVGKVLAEVARLEKIFSLYRDDSLISKLNREGRLNDPPADMLALLSLSSDIHKMTKGAFDPTIQPLWDMYAGYFRRHPNTETPPPQREIEKALGLVGFDNVRFDNRTVAFAKKGMGLSLNGIAQGYITDKVVELLRKNGIRRALVDMGEIRGFDLDKRHTWQVGIRNPSDEEKVLLTVPLQNEAFATSGGYGTTMDEAGRFTHLFDPRTGVSTPRYRSISVMAATAATADALSTAFSIMDEADIQTASRAAGAKIWLVMPDGSLQTIG